MWITKLIRFLVLLGTVLLIVAFTLQNTGSVEIHYWIGSVTLGLPVLMWLALSLGVLTTLLFLFPGLLVSLYARYQLKRLKSHQAGSL